LILKGKKCCFMNLVGDEIGYLKKNKNKNENRGKKNKWHLTDIFL